MAKNLYLVIILLFSISQFSYSNDKHYIVVAQDGSGDFATITQALQSLPMFNYERVVIFIKAGTYTEKIKITQDYITLRGENRELTKIRYSQLRSDWEAKKDSIGPAVVNIFADDVVIENLSIANTQPEIGPHAFSIYGTGTRTIINNCIVTSNGGDTISLWNYKTGMYYHANCSFIGAVDFVCPRGWCYIDNSRFYQMKKTASIWHAGGYDKNQKLVIKNSYFEGNQDFHLGRHHYDACFFLLNCKFSNKMLDTPIYRVSYNDITKDRAFNWGQRYYFYNCTREDGNYKWFENNLNTVGGNIKPEDITCRWTFDGKWDPESLKGPEVLKYNIEKNTLLLEFNELLTVTGIPEFKTKTGKTFSFAGGNGSNCLMLKTDGNVNKEDLKEIAIINQAKITGTTASLNERNASLIILP